MPSLNWDIFTGLPGSVEKNFELLCRGIVRRNFGSYGCFRALANQPGVEFHLRLSQRCDALGEPCRWWGWQCKWFRLTAKGQLTSAQRGDVRDGIKKSKTHVPGLTDWVLWTRQPLSKQDQKWFDGLSSGLGMNLHSWHSDEVDNLLSGQAAVLRGTYFGELVLTPDVLRERHEEAVAPIRARWQPAVHHIGHAERELRRMLGEPEAWSSLRKLAIELRMCADAVKSLPAVPAPLQSLVVGVVETAQRSANALDRVAGGIADGDLDLLRDELAGQPRALPADVSTAPRRLRAKNQPAGLYATNAVAACHDTLRMLGEVEGGYSSRLVAVLARAGCGKTHLAAQLTAGTIERPPGILLHGRDLHAHHTLDDLARRVSIAAQPVPSMEALLAAVDAAGQRARKRLPVFIDGLNESEDPRTWKPLLATLETALAKYAYVLLVCTLRPEFADDAIPDGTRRLEIDDFGEEMIEAVHEHFRYWKIDATDVSLPGFLRHPLTLRLFCEVTNTTRQQVVGVGAMPGSLASLFDRYLEQVGVRVVELASRTYRFYAQDVNAAIAAIGNRLWESHARAIELGELRTMLGDAQRPWDQSIVRALEHEGVLLRMPSKDGDAFVPVYDLLGGHIIANALLARHGQMTFEAWVKNRATTTSLGGSYDVRHPLGDDVLGSLVEQVPRRFHSKQIWQLVAEPLRGRALRLAARLEPSFLDAVTVDALIDLVRAGDSEILDRLWQLRGTRGHPLNAEGLDRALRTMTVADRDLRWTEWVRRNGDDFSGSGKSIYRDLALVDSRWRSGQRRTGDRLRARWVMWTLTSTNRRLRDQATRVLFWFGHVDPEGLFSLTVESLLVNDAYVGERMLAASYGVVMSHQQSDPEFGLVLKPFLNQLASSLVGASAIAATNHYLTRVYVRGIVTFATKYYASSVPVALCGNWSFATPTAVRVIPKDDPASAEVGQAIHMDFENYTLGRLFEDRGNYDMGHAGHQAAVAHVCGVVRALGWSAANFDAVDRHIAEQDYRHVRGDHGTVERYGKKYGWIGFFTYAGQLEVQRPFSDVDIDPSFPDKPPVDGEPSATAAWLSPAIESHELWIRDKSTLISRSLLVREKIGDHNGPWIAVHGELEAKDRVLGRLAWSYISALVIPRKSEREMVAALNSGRRPWLCRDIPSDHYTFAGEIPWHPSYASEALADDGQEDPYRENFRDGRHNILVEILAHRYAWESYHSEMNHAGSVRVPSKHFSSRFDLRSVPRGFDQCMADGTRATITLSGVDGLKGDILYVREDLLWQYVGNRAVVWFAFGERELRPYPPTPPKWLVNVNRQQENAWRQVLTHEDLMLGAKPKSDRKTPKRKASKTIAKKKSAKGKRSTASTTRRSRIQKKSNQLSPPNADVEGMIEPTSKKAKRVGR